MEFQRITPNICFEEPEVVDSGNADHTQRLLDLLDMELSGSSTAASKTALLKRIENVLQELKPYTVEQVAKVEEEVFETFTFSASDAGTVH
jgi:hypothetical protein